MVNGLLVQMFATALLLIVSPILLVLMVAIRLHLGSPVLFRQARPGRGGKPFIMFKFRTMRDAQAPDGTPLPDAERLTAFGRFLRSTSLDELPELINVIRGEMALVGPRPLLMQYLSLYTPKQSRRHEVLPGITGWAQINGRNAITWEQKFDLDIWYVDHRSFWLDCRIILITILKVIRRDGIAAQGEATVAPFTGTPLGQESTCAS